MPDTPDAAAVNLHIAGAEPKKGPRPPVIDNHAAQANQLAKEIESLQTERADLEHSLEMQGFPQILNEGRLSDTERIGLLKQLSQLNAMEIRLLDLKNKKVEMETEVSL
jgi:hypothetical protein